MSCKNVHFALVVGYDVAFLNIMYDSHPWKERRNCFLRRFLQQRSYRDEKEAWHWDEIPFSSIILVVIEEWCPKSFTSDIEDNNVAAEPLEEPLDTNLLQSTKG